MSDPTAHSSDGSFTRRTLLGFAAAAAVPVVLASCAARPRSSDRLPASVDSFEVAYRETLHRCLSASAGDLSSGDVTAIILLHGAGQTGSQWFRIGLVDALLRLDSSFPSVVAVAPEIGRPAYAESMITDALFPAIEQRFSPDRYAISGISRGGAMALDLALRVPTLFRSVGLHSPASMLDHTVEPMPWRCWLDIGDDDYLLDGALQTGRSLRESGVDITEHLWIGEHQEKYWAAHIDDYLAFHLAA